MYRIVQSAYSVSSKSIVRTVFVQKYVWNTTFEESLAKQLENEEDSKKYPMPWGLAQKFVVNSKQQNCPQVGNNS